MADEICQENDLCLDESGVSANNFQQKNWKKVFSDKWVKWFNRALAVLLITLIVLHTGFVISEQSTSQEYNNKTQEKPQTERLASNDHRCLATVKKIYITELTDEECISKEITQAMDLDWTECTNDKYEKIYIKMHCICEGYNLSRFSKCKRRFDVNLFGCSNFKNECKDVWNDAARISSCPNDKYLKNATCRKGYTGDFCQNKIQDEFVTCDESLNTVHGMPNCSIAVHNQEECLIYQDDSVLVCTQGEPRKGLPFCNETKRNSPSQSSMKANNQQDAQRPNSSKNGDYAFNVVLIILEFCLCVLNIMPKKYLKCGGENKAKLHLFLTAVTVFLLFVNTALGTLLASRRSTADELKTVIVAFIFIVLVILLRFADFYSVIRKLPNPCQK